MNDTDNVILIILTIFLIIGIIGFYGAGFFASKIDHSTCVATVDNNEVYRGKCHFLSVEPIGENGNTKKLEIYDGVLLIIPYKIYVSDNIIVNPAN